MGKAGSRWRHGWVPLNAAAVKLKRGKSAGGGKAGVKRRAAGTSASSTRKRLAAAPRKTGGLPKVQGISNPNASRMTNADKVKAAAIMFGSGSRQHKAAMKRFR